MHICRSTLYLSPAHISICDKASVLVSLGYMLQNFQPFERGGISEQDMAINLQQYGSLIHDVSQGLFADIEQIVDPPTTNTKGEN